MARNRLESRNGTLVQWKSKHVWALCKNFFEGLCTGFNFKISKVSCASCNLLFSYCTNCPGMPWPWPQFHRSTRRTVYRLPCHDHHRYASSTHLWLVFHQHLEVSSEMSPRSFTVGLDHDTCGRVGMCENQTGTALQGLHPCPYYQSSPDNLPSEQGTLCNSKEGRDLTGMGIWACCWWLLMVFQTFQIVSFTALWGRATSRTAYSAT